MPNDNWITPRWVFEKLGQFDLDPCAHTEQPWDTAYIMISLPGDGLAYPWHGRVWCNPPYSRGNPEKWVGRLADHGDGTALLNICANAKWFHRVVWNRASAVLIPEGRIDFCKPDGTPAGSPRYESIFVAYGAYDAAKLLASGIAGRFFLL